MKRAIIIIISLTINNILFSQSYFTAGGVRFGTDWGITVQQKILKHTTFEAIFQSSLIREELMFTGLLEHHFPIFTKHFNIYTGAGFHQAYFTDINTNYDPPYGLSLIAGAELSLARFAISYDYKPAFNLYGGESSWYNQSAVSIRYVLIRQKAFKKMRKKRERRKKRKKRKERLENFFEKE